MSTPPLDPNSLFASGQRTEMYDDRAANYPTLGNEEAAQPTSPPAPVIRDESPAPVQPLTGAVIEHGGTQELVPVSRRDRAAEPAPGLWQRLMIKMGAAKAPPTQHELEDAENERIIRQSTWTRAMSVVVANPKGQSAKTPLTLLVAGALADVRGGGVVAWEATEVPGDLSEAAHCRAVIAKAVEEFGKVDVLVSNAAYQMTRESLEEIPDEEWEHTFKLNVGAYFYLAKAAVPHMAPGSAIIGRLTRRSRTSTMRRLPLSVAARDSSRRSELNPRTSEATCPMECRVTESSPRLGSTRSM